VGIMNVVTDVGANMDDEREPTWDEAVAALEAAVPVEVMRQRRQITVVYRYVDGIFTATSPEVAGFRVSGSSLFETRTFVKQDLERFLDPTVDVRERFPAADPEIRSAAAGRIRFKADSLPGVIVLSTTGAARAFLSSARGSIRRVRAS
jgi:hypothetical protein